MTDTNMSQTPRVDNSDPEAQYELSWTWNSAAMGCHAALEEIGAPYSLRFIDFEKPWPDEDLALNPNRKVPTLIDRLGGQGNHVVYQSGAILMYLADKHPDAHLIPPTGSLERGACYQWMFFMAEMLQPCFHMFYYPERHTTGTTADSRNAIEAKAIEWIEDLWGRIDAAIGNNQYFLGASLSVCDLYVLPMARWNDSDDRFPALRGYPNLSRIVSETRSRPSVQRMIKAHCTD